MSPILEKKIAKDLDRLAEKKIPAPFFSRSIYRQNLNSDFTDSALGSSEKSPMPYGNFHLRESTVQSILANPKYGPKSELGANMYTYLKFGLPRVLPPRPHSGSGGAREQVSPKT